MRRRERTRARTTTRHARARTTVSTHEGAIDTDYVIIIVECELRNQRGASSECDLDRRGRTPRSYLDAFARVRGRKDRRRKVLAMSRANAFSALGRARSEWSRATRSRARALRGANARARASEGREETHGRRAGEDAREESRESDERAHPGAQRKAVGGGRGSGRGEDARGGKREDLEFSFGADYGGDELTTQGDAVVKGVAAVAEKPSGLTLDVDYLQELIAIQQDCPKDIGFFGTRNMGFLHQQLIEILSYALCLTGNHIYTSGATGTNAAVIRGALRAERPELLTVVLPQSLSKQPRESRELLESVKQIIDAPENDDMPLAQASRICNDTIVSKVKQVIVFAFHDSRLLLETCRNAKAMKRLVTLFFLD